MVRRLKKDASREESLLNEPFGHTGIPNLIRLFAPYTKHIVFVHFGSWFYKAGAEAAKSLIKGYGREHGVLATVGHDGMVLMVGKEVSNA
jgi:hypothetical protein